jgi:hypothetical protein
MNKLTKRLEWVKDGDRYKASLSPDIEYMITRHVGTVQPYKLTTFGSSNPFDGLYLALSSAKYGAQIHHGKITYEKENSHFRKRIV